MALAGNLAGLREWLTVRRPQKLPLDWHYFWATSRVVKDTINEYPLWSLLFADLHAHVLSMPLLLLFLASALQFVRAHADPAAFPRTRLLSAALLGFFAAAETLTNAWDAPLVAGLLVLTGFAAALSGPGSAVARAARAVVGLSAAAATAPRRRRARSGRREAVTRPGGRTSRRGPRASTSRRSSGSSSSS